MNNAPSRAWEELRTAATVVVVRAEQLRNGRPMPPELAALERALEELAAHGVGACRARQTSDQMTCECGNVWDMNDPDPPVCPRGVMVDAPPRVTIPADLARRLIERLEYPGPSWLEHRAELAAELRTAAGAEGRKP